MPKANPENFKVVKQLARPDIVFAVARKPQTYQIYCGGSDFSVYQLDLDQAKPEPKELGRHDSYVTGLALAGTTLVSGGYDGRLIWWDIDSRSKIRDVAAHSKWVRHVAVTHDGNVFASVADDMVCRLWEVSTGRLIRELRGHAALTPAHFSSMLYAVAISGDGSRIATGDKLGHIVIWDRESGRSVVSLERRALYMGPDPATSFDRRDPRIGLFSRRPLSRSRRQRPSIQHRSPRRPGASGSLRLAEGRADARLCQRQVQGPGPSPLFSPAG